MAVGRTKGAARTGRLSPANDRRVTTTDLSAGEIARLNTLAEPFRDPTRGGRDTGRSKAVATAVREWMARQGDA